MKCKVHPRYKAIRQPTSKCPTCWKIFLNKHKEGLKELNDKIVGRPIRNNKQVLQPKKGKNYAEVVFIGDLHLGSPQFAQQKFLNMIDYVLKNNLYAFLMGDWLIIGLPRAVMLYKKSWLYR